jgi:SAM-dependent methyltransferase
MKILEQFLGRIKGNQPLGYRNVSATLREARNRGVSLDAYILEAWGSNGKVADTMDRINSVCMDRNIASVLEIGPGTGVYLSRTLDLFKPATYQIYETAEDWRRYLAKNFNVINLPADGEKLSSTETNSVDLLLAHGVFVYTPFLVSVSYLEEAKRVVKPGGIIAFDIFTERTLDEDARSRWLASEHRYPCVFPESICLDIFLGFHLKSRFFCPLGVTRSEYFIFEAT